MVLYSYNAQDENDLSVERGQCVTVLNSDDPDWYWVSKFDGQEGFVPSGFIYPLDAIQRQREFPVYVTSTTYVLSYRSKVILGHLDLNQFELVQILLD